MIGKHFWEAERYTTLINNGSPSKRLDVAILGDGYSAEDLPMFHADVDTIVQAFQDIEPMKSYIRHFNFYRVNLYSKQSGVSDRYAEGGAVKIASALGTLFSPIASRRLVGPDPWVWHLANRSGVPWDVCLVVVNTPRRGGATLFSMGIGYASRNSSDFPRIMIHESGHAIAKLMDEYTGEIPDFPRLKGKSLPNWLLPFANVTLNGKRPKWSAWIDSDTACPSDADRCDRRTVGAFEGAAYTSFGTYRPTQSCFMRRHSSAFCPVCQEQYIKRIYKWSPLADGFFPYFEPPQPAIRVSAETSTTFSAAVLYPERIRTTWRIRRRGHLRWQTKQQTDTYHDFSVQLPLSALSKSQHALWQVECLLEDISPKIRKPDVKKRASQSHRWQIMSSAP